MDNNRTRLTQIQIGLAGIGAAVSVIVVATLKYLGHDDESNLSASIMVGVLVLIMLLPIWMVKFRLWWHQEGKRDRSAEIGTLYQLLEQERAAREAAETDLLEIRRQKGLKAVNDIRDILREDAEHKALLERAESAERMVVSLDKQLKAQAEKLERDGALTRALLTRLEGTPEAQTTNTTEGLIFPYSTKQLEAMQSAAIKFWADHDPANPAPYGIQKAVQNYLIDTTGGSARKVVELAAAIKPDNLPQ